MSKPNYYEQWEQDMAERYVYLVNLATETLAPKHPWWFVELSPEQQLWRWMDIRDDIMSWLADVAGFLPAIKTVADLMGHLEDIFTEPIEQLVPPQLLVDERGDALKEMVQAAGPREAAKHLRKMEKMVAQRALAEGVLASAASDQFPNIEEQIRANLGGATALPAAPVREPAAPAY